MKNAATRAKVCWLTNGRVFGVCRNVIPGFEIISGNMIGKNAPLKFQVASTIS